MIWFILLIFIAIILIGAAATDLPENRISYNADEENSKLASMVNKTFEEELCRKISMPSYKEQILNIIKDDLIYIYGNSWKTLFDRTWYVPHPITIAFNTVENIVLMLLLSKSGFIPKCYRFAHITISNFDVANSYECLKILHCVEKNIQVKRDQNIKLVFSPEVIFKRDNRNKILELPQYDYPCSGQFYWSFQSICTHSKFKINDIHNTRLVQSCINSSIGERSNKKNPYKNKLVL